MDKRKFDASVCLLATDEKVCLAEKLEKVCVGMYCGAGGNPDPSVDADMPDTAVRELWEEFHVEVDTNDLEKVAEIVCENPTFVCVLHVFLVRKWRGSPHVLAGQSDMGPPKWFSIFDLPANIPPGDRHWMPGALTEGKKYKGIVFYGPDQQTLIGDPVIEEVDGFPPFEPYIR